MYGKSVHFLNSLKLLARFPVHALWDLSAFGLVNSLSCVGLGFRGLIDIVPLLFIFHFIVENCHGYDFRLFASLFTGWKIPVTECK